ncbi:MAG TPA: hypothetical protein VFZ09_20015 [Archangium sp.]|uniref:hypothetical protein n=1 Tax=Archangium sp. TaxID=1872627 RepID=UPI002E35352A|nr:hypothetical protein [Archangium sp.]HEX5748536.1 hypothetical protein [Archangium sp.]
MSKAYFERVSPTFIENWAPALHAFSIPQVDVPLSRLEAQALEARTWHRKSTDQSEYLPIDSLMWRLDVALRQFPEGAFVRLGSRSSKDSAYAVQHGLRVRSGEAAIRLLTEGSERTAFDLRLALQLHYAPHIFVREWMDIPRWAEFRCFMKDRRLVGISQYDCLNVGIRPEITRHAETLHNAIREFSQRFAAASHLDNVVFDVFVEGMDTPGPLDVRLLELNPFFPKTDPCLFDWSVPADFDGSFRFLGASTLKGRDNLGRGRDG